MEEILQVIGGVQKEMKEGFEDNKKMIRRLQEKVEWKEKEWKMEKQHLQDRIEKLEDILERQEKQKKNNIIIKGLQIDKDQDLKSKVQDFISNEVGVQATIKKAYKVGKTNRTAIIAKLETWQQKKDIMENKKKLKGKIIIIDNDLTTEDMNIQQEIANEEETSEKKIKVDYKELKLNDIWYKWDNSAKELKLKN
ncbi:hypothetical protein RN001_012634 [Aquatica leii]|uniref:Uncharacterized protein n=1 Tax=Aquatica leii TaxID=1421715 RepID=A0AAN7SDF0_9COLE|nr:hypothetical protein RN001_012634 [Aquatica leii]